MPTCKQCGKDLLKYCLYSGDYSVESTAPGSGWRFEPCNCATEKPTKKPLEFTEKALNTLLRMTVKGIKVEQWTNERLAKWLLENIWADYNIDSDEGAILGEIIERLHPTED